MSDARNQKAVLVLFGDIQFYPLTASKYDETCFVDRVDLAIYVPADSVATAEIKAEEIKQRGNFNGYVIPSWYATTEANKDDFAHKEKTREIVYGEGIDEQSIPKEYPTDFDWDVVENNYPNYYTSDDIAWNDALQKEYDDEGFELTDEEYEESIHIPMMEDKPDVLTEKEWVFNQLADGNRRLFNLACEARDI